jgi:hypothetical protein
MKLIIKTVADGECALYDGEAGAYERLPLSGVAKDLRRIPWRKSSSV